MFLRICKHCSQYTLKNKCPNCGSETESAHPARFSPEDPNSSQRISNKERNGLLPYQIPDIPL